MVYFLSFLTGLRFGLTNSSDIVIKQRDECLVGRLAEASLVDIREQLPGLNNRLNVKENSRYMYKYIIIGKILRATR